MINKAGNVLKSIPHLALALYPLKYMKIKEEMTMKKRMLSILLALVMCLSLFPMTALAAEDDVVYTDTRGNQITIPGGAKSCATKVVEFKPGDPWTSDERAMDPNDVLGVPDYDDAADTNYLCLGAGGFITLEFDIAIVDGEGNDIYIFEIGPRVEATTVEVSSDLKNWYPVGDADGSLSGVDLNGKVPEGASFKYVRVSDRDGSSGGWPGADIDAVAGLNAKVPAQGSEWANEGLAKAEELGLIPDCLEGQDLTSPITRAEFAAVAVKTYEVLSGTPAIPAIATPFTDSKDVEVLKAYNLGVVAGTSATTFAPDALLNREQAATMLTRVFQRVTIPGWPENNPPLEYTKPAPFVDDADISNWAKDSVYFMAANGIIAGVGNNKFAPKAVTTEQQAQGYAQATREQALLIAVRMVEKLGGQSNGR